MRPRLFSPKDMARVVMAVEWEDELKVYRDGTTNQQQFMRALGILWERWMRGWSVPDFFSAVHEAGSNNFASGLRRILQSMPERVAMLKGFYEGIWYGANPRAAAGSRSTAAAAEPTGSGAQLAEAELRRWYDAMVTIWSPKEEEQ